MKNSIDVSNEAMQLEIEMLCSLGLNESADSFQALLADRNKIKTFLESFEAEEYNRQMF